MKCTTHHHACDCREAEFAALRLKTEMILGVLDAREAELALAKAENGRLRAALEYLAYPFNFYCHECSGEEQAEYARKALGRE